MSAVVASRGRSRSIAWLIALGIVLAALNLRTAVTSVGAVLDQVSTSLGMSSAVTGLLTTLPVLCFAVFGALTPPLSRRVGEHRLLLAALVLVGAGLVLRAVVGSADEFLAASVLALSGGAIGNVLIPSLIKRHFPRRLDAMTTVYSTALAIGTMIPAAATVPIQRAADGNWHVALGVWAALAAVAAVPWLALSRGKPERSGDNPSHLGPRELVRSKLAWAMAGYFGTQSFIAYVMFGWLPRLLQDGGYSSGQIGMVLAAFTGLAIPVSLVVPAVSARFPDQRPMVIILAVLYAVGFAGLLTGHALWVWTLVVAVAMGTFPLALSMLTQRTRTAEAIAGLAAFGQSTGYLIAGAGPLAFGVLYQLSGGWAVPFLLLFGVVAAQIVAGWYAGADRVLEEELYGSRPRGGGAQAVPAVRDAGHVSRGVRDRIVPGARKRAAAGAGARRDRGGDAVPSARPASIRPASRREDRRSAPCR